MTKYLLLAATAIALASPSFAQQGGGGGRGPQMTPEEREAAFVKADANKDGNLDAAEYKTSMGERAAQMPEDRLKASFDRRDADKNGKISKAEYTAPPPPRPAQ
jgi:hypothetical protein